MSSWKQDGRFWEARSGGTAGEMAELFSELPRDVVITVGMHLGEEVMHVVVYDSEQKIVAL